MTTIETTAAQALTSDSLKQLEGPPLGAFLQRQRWFSTKHDGDSATLVEIIPLFPSCDAVLAQVDVREKHSSVKASYLVPIALTATPVSEQATIGTVKTPTATLSLVDAVHDVRFRDSLLAYLVDGRRFTTDGTQIRFSRYAPIDVTPADGSRVSLAEQSNTSIIYGDSLIVKLFRKLTPGENPDIEIGAFLAERRVEVTPTLIGSATMDGDRGPTALLMAQKLIPQARDLWDYVTSALRSGIADPFIDDAASLGRTTRELHEALAGATDKHGFVPANGTREDLVRWCSSIRHEIADTTALLKRTTPAIAGPRAAIIAQGLRDIEQHDQVLRDVIALELTTDVDVGLTIRHHGDYHLGQVIRDARGRLYIIDFEGEPARPLAERRALHSPLRDVAGMMRSFAYAASIAALESASDDWDAALFRAESWQKRARDAFMQGYLSVTSALLPKDVATIERLVRLFEIEKAFYELRYELAHRPDWVWVPMRGITEIVRDSLRTAPRPSGDAQPTPP